MNEPVSLSSFGIFTNECSSYCKEKDGLELWLSLVNNCYVSSSTNRMLLETKYKLNSSLFVGLVCSIVSLLCFMMSYNMFRYIYFISHKINQIHHTK